MVATTEQINLHTLLSQLFLLQSIPTYLLLRYIIIAPFGRHVTKQTRWWFGPLLNAKLSWFLFEIPNLIWVWYCYWHWCDPDIFYLDSPPNQQMRSVISIEGNNMQISTNAILLSLFALHYINRAIIYPLQMNINSQRVPLIVSLCAGIITCWNGFIQTFYLVQVQSFSPISLTLSSILDNIQCWIGICIFFIGMGINIKSDSVLRNLRKDNQQKKKQQKQKDTTAIDNQQHKYYIPFSPLFTYISCPNHAGEILEWFGFSIASNFSLPTIAFFIYSSSNLIPRAIAHHEWYKNKFDDYPKERRWAVIPFAA